MLIIHAYASWAIGDKLRNGYQDFTIFYCAAKILRSGLGSQLYNEGLQLQVQRSFAPNVPIRQGPLPFNHPAFEALLFVPFARLSYFSAYLLWTVANLGMLALLFFLLRPHLSILKEIALPEWMFAWLAFFPVFIGLLQGQDSILLLLLFVLAYLALHSRRDFNAGCWLGLGLFRFQFALPFLLILLWQKKWRAVLGFALIASALGGLSLALVGWTGTLTYIDYAQRVERGTTGAIVAATMPNLRGLAAWAAVAGVPPYVVMGTVVLLSVAVLLFASSIWGIDRTGRLAMCAALLAVSLASYHDHEYDLSLLLLPILLVGEHLKLTKAAAKSSIGLLGPMIALWSPLPAILWFGYPQANLLALVLLWWLWSMGRRASAAAASG